VRVFTAGHWVLTVCFCVCVLLQGEAVYNVGTMTAIDCTFVSRPGSTVYLTTTATAHVSNCTFTKDTSTAGHDNFIYTSGVYVDYGNCTPGRNPGLSGANILVDDGGFTGCPVACPLGTWGRGGPTATLQELKTGCGVGCETCPEGAMCNATALPAPNYCPVGHYNPDKGSQTASGCRECESGSFQAETGSLQCTPCPAGTFSPTKGSTACQSCAAGGFCEEVGASSASVFKLCLPGTWSDTVRLSSSEGCRPCGEGTYQPITGANSSSSCLACPVGTVSAVSGVQFCSRCLGGSYQNLTGGTACFPCTAGSYCPEGAAAPLPCKQGTYSDATGLSSPTQCTEAVPGFYATTGSIEQMPCSPGTRQPEPGMGQCGPCVAGTFQETEGQQTCNTCPLGAPLCTLRAVVGHAGFTLSTIPNHTD
jgi:hypothetical protein